MSDQENDPPTKPPGNPKAATSPTRLTSSPIRMSLSPVRAGPRQTEESEVAVPQGPDRNVQIIGNGHPIATSGTPVYDEDPLDLTIGLHFSTENLITEHRDQRSSLVRAFEAMRAEFMSQIEEDLHFWISLSTCHTQVDFIMGVEQEEPRIFVAVTIDNAIEAEKPVRRHDVFRVHKAIQRGDIHMRLRYQLNVTFPNTFLPIRFYTNDEVDLGAKSKKKGKQSNTAGEASASSSATPAPAATQGAREDTPSATTPVYNPTTPIQLYSVDIGHTAATLKRRYRPEHVKPPRSLRHRDLPKSVPMREFRGNVFDVDADGQSLFGASISLSNGEVAGTLSAFVCLTDPATDQWIVNDNGQRVVFMFTNHHVLRPYDNAMLTLDQARHLDREDSVITHLSRTDREGTTWSFLGLIRETYDYLNELIEQRLVNPSSRAFQKLDPDTQNTILDQLCIGHHRLLQLKQMLADFNTSSPRECPFARLICSSGRSQAAYDDISSEFSGNVTDMISMDYAFAQVSEEFWPFCINKISSGTPFPVDSYPVAFDGFTSLLSVTGFAPVNPYDVVLKVPSRTTGATYGMVQPNRRRSKRSHDDENNYEVTVTPIDKNSFSEEGDSGAAVVNGKGEMVGIIVSGKNFVTVEQDSIATPEKRTKSPLRKRAPTPPDVPTTASLTPRTPIEYTARKKWTEGFRQVTILPIAPMQADLWNRFGMRMELYRPSDEVRSRYPSKSTVRQEQFAAYPPRPKAHTLDTYAWYKKACEEGVFTQKEQHDWKSKVATEGSSFGALTFRPGKIARTS
ncbi:hypothetical protein D6C99_06920 [Aureobasidium pullulans]|nr:hypothetical protein D6C99_06920 [Aureobasidium pullulans]